MTITTREDELHIALVREVARRIVAQEGQFDGDFGRAVRQRLNLGVRHRDGRWETFYEGVKVPPKLIGRATVAVERLADAMHTGDSVLIAAVDVLALLRGEHHSQPPQIGQTPS